MNRRNTFIIAGLIALSFIVLSIFLIVQVNTIKEQIATKVNCINTISQIDELSLSILKDIHNISVENKSSQSETLKEIVALTKKHSSLSPIALALKNNAEGSIDQSLILGKQALEQKLLEIKKMNHDIQLEKRKQISADSSKLNSYWALTHTLVIIACIMSLLLSYALYKIKKTTNELGYEKNKSEWLFNKSVDTIISCDKEGFITEFNQAAVKNFGYQKKEIIGRHVSMLSNKKDSALILKQISKKGVFRGEVTNIRKDGSEFKTHLSANLIYDAEGELIGTMGISRIMDRKKT